MFKGRRTVEFSYPIDEEFFEEGPDGDDGEFGDDDALSQCEAYSRLQRHGKARHVLGIIKEKRALNFYRVQWEKNGEKQLSTLCAGMLTKFLGENKTREKKNPLTSAISHKDYAHEVTSFAYSFLLKHKIIRQKENKSSQK